MHRERKREGAPSGRGSPRAAPCQELAPEGCAIPVFEPPAVDCRVVVRRQGLLSASGHDLELDVTACSVEVDLAQEQVRARFDPRSLRVVASLEGERRNPEAPAAHDRATIERDVARVVLEAERYPEIRFESSSVQPAGDGWELRGALTLHGATRDVSTSVRRLGDRVIAEVRLDQRDFGIRPFSALLGALKVRPDVSITLSLPAP